VDTSFTPAQEALRRELADYMARLMTPELRAELALPWGAEGGGPLWRAALRQMGQDGWIGLGWPREWGGRGLGPVEQYIFIEEVTRSGFSFPYLTPESFGPAIAEFGTDEIEQRVLPGILGGELVMAIGYTEPQAGTDLAALKTRAVRDGEHYVINGQKVFTSLAHLADYVFLAVRRRSRDALAPQGHLDPAGADRQPRLLAHADPHRRGGRDQRHLLRQRARAGQPPGRARERELEGHHPPADQRLDRGLWRQLKESGLAAPGLPEAQGGAGLGFFETCLTLEQLGRTVAAVPLAGHAVGLLALHGPAVQTVSDALAADDAWLACSARTDAGNTLRVQDGRGCTAACPRSPSPRARDSCCCPRGPRRAGDCACSTLRSPACVLPNRRQPRWSPARACTARAPRCSCWTTTGGSSG
jgi:alkylation response protein AidB-like acyl-CoA dehydrogenase